MADPGFKVANTDLPGEWATAVTPSDSADLPNVCRGLYVGSTGNITVDMPDGATILFSNVVSGIIFPVRVKRVRSTGTTATGLVAIY